MPIVCLYLTAINIRLSTQAIIKRVTNEHIIIIITFQMFSP